MIEKMSSIKSEASISADMLIALIIPALIAVYYYGARAAVIILLSVGVCAVTESVCIKLRGNVLKFDFSSVVTGLIIALMMSAAVPYYAVVTADLFAIILCKHAFGGKSSCIFNGAAVSFVFTSICFPNEMLNYPRPFAYPDLYSGVAADISLSPSIARSLAASDELTSISFTNIMVGKFPGPMGTGFLILMLITSLFLISRRAISAIAFFSQFVIVFVGMFINYNYDLKYTAVSIGSGMIVFSMIFISCDYSTMPTTRISRLILGILTGILTLFFRMHFKIENPVIYAAIILAPIGIELDRKMISLSKIIRSLKNKNSQQTSTKGGAENER